MSDSIPAPSKAYLVLAVALVVACGLLAPMFIKRRGGCGMPEQVSNLRQIGLALFEFEIEYGAFPNDATAAKITAEHPEHGLDLSSNSSNAIFRQLFAARMTQSEAMFYAKAYSATKSDGDIRPGHVLEKGEVGFAYIAGISSEDNPNTIIAFAPIIPGTTRFDSRPFEGKAVFLRIDNSVTSLAINEHGQVIEGGKDILSPDHRFWNGKAPDIRYPELAPPPPPTLFEKIFGYES